MVFDVEAEPLLLSAGTTDTNATGLAISPDARRIAVAGGGTVVRDLPTLTGETAPAWLPDLLELWKGVSYEKTTRQFGKISAGVTEAKLRKMAKVEFGLENTRLLRWFLGLQTTISPFSRLSVEEQISRWCQPGAATRNPGETLATPHAQDFLTLVERVRQLQGTHPMATVWASTKLEELPGHFEHPSVVLRTAEALYTAGASQTALALLEREKSRVTDPRLADCSHTLAALCSPETETLGLWMSMASGWLPEAGVKRLETLVEQAEGWRQTPAAVEWSETTKGTGRYPPTLLSVWWLRSRSQFLVCKQTSSPF
jgi:hypothetical protein